LPGLSKKVSTLLLPIYVHGADVSSSSSFTRSDSLKRHRESKKCQENQRANALRDSVPGANANEASTVSRVPPPPTFAQDVHITVQAQGSGPQEASAAPPPPVIAANFSIGVTEEDKTNLFGSP
jgi:hypothetical protein